MEQPSNIPIANAYKQTLSKKRERHNKQKPKSQNQN